MQARSRLGIRAPHPREDQSLSTFQEATYEY